MRTSAGISRLPYQIMVVMRDGKGTGRPEAVKRTRELHPAMDWVRRMTIAWSQLVGARAPILYWYVVDCRDGTETHMRDYFRGGYLNGNR